MYEIVKLQSKYGYDILELIWIDCVVKFEMGSLTTIKAMLNQD